MSKNMSKPNASAPLAVELRPATARVSVVIVVWNAQKYVMECLESLQEHCGEICDDVIVVDNASTDGTPELVAERFPNFKLIRNSENVGFAKANNIGIAQSSGEYICLVNSDVKFTGDCISPMLKYAAENPRVGMIGPQMLAADGAVRRSTMRFPSVWYSFSRAVGLDVLFKESRLFGGQLMRDFDHLRTMPVEVLNGWFVVVRRSALERVGLLDPQFFMYGEDVDWCYRFVQDGEDVVFFAEVGAIHYGGASSSNAPVHFFLEMWRANWQYWQKHHGWLAQEAFLFTALLHHGIRLIGSTLRYLCLPSQRPDSAFKFKRGLVCLQWAIRTMFRPSTSNTATANAGQPKAASAGSVTSKKGSLRSFAGHIRRKILCSVYQRNASLRDRGPIVTFTFDDFPRTASVVGGDILQKVGARGTYYTAAGLMNASTDLGDLCRVEDLDFLLGEGHELATQTFGHSSARNLSLSDFADDVKKGREALEKIIGYDSGNFAYPYGHVTLGTKKALGAELASCRSNIAGFNGPEMDLNLLRANRLYGGVEYAAEAEELIRENVKRKSWLIFYTHDVRPEPSEYGCTPELMEAAVSAAVQAGCRILTVQEVLEEIGVQTGHPKGQAPRTVLA
jgi:GT2 family glycosyltransferase/peptidoglycan/xylan/chitin deacetylase (PgdA/CDA1 family)